MDDALFVVDAKVVDVDEVCNRLHSQYAKRLSYPSIVKHSLFIFAACTDPPGAQFTLTDVLHATLPRHFTPA